MRILTRAVGVALAGCAAAVALAHGHAMAADLGAPRVARPPEDFAPPVGRPYLDIERWTGFYFGGTLGGSFGRGRTDGDIGAYRFEQDGKVGTVFAGYNWQIGPTVLGVETDVGIGDVSSATATALGTFRSEMGAFGSLRGRAGLLVSPAMLVYGTAGLAWANMDFRLDGFAAESKTLTGYQVGLGTEFLLSRNVGLRLEYLYTDFGRATSDHSGLRNAYEPDHHTVRAGISFKF